jgi:hypothetical protein
MARCQDESRVDEYACALERLSSLRRRGLHHDSEGKSVADILGAIRRDHALIDSKNFSAHGRRAQWGLLVRVAPGGTGVKDALWSAGR